MENINQILQSNAPIWLVAINSLSIVISLTLHLYIASHVRLGANKHTTNCVRDFKNRHTTKYPHILSELVNMNENCHRFKPAPLQYGKMVAIHHLADLFSYSKKNTPFFLRYLKVNRHAFKFDRAWYCEPKVFVNIMKKYARPMHRRLLELFHDYDYDHNTIIYKKK